MVSHTTSLHQVWSVRSRFVALVARNWSDQWFYDGIFCSFGSVFFSLLSALFVVPILSTYFFFGNDLLISDRPPIKLWIVSPGFVPIVHSACTMKTVESLLCW